MFKKEKARTHPPSNLLHVKQLLKQSLACTIRWKRREWSRCVPPSPRVTSAALVGGSYPLPGRAGWETEDAAVPELLAQAEGPVGPQYGPVCRRRTESR